MNNVEKSIWQTRGRGVVAVCGKAENCRAVRGSQKAEGELTSERLPEGWCRMQLRRRGLAEIKYSRAQEDGLQRCVGADGASRRRKGKGITPSGVSAGESMTYVMK